MTVECSSLNELSPSNGPEGSGDILHEDGKGVRAGGGRNAVQHCLLFTPRSSQHLWSPAQDLHQIKPATLQHECERDLQAPPPAEELFTLLVAGGMTGIFPLVGRPCHSGRPHICVHKDSEGNTQSRRRVFGGEAWGFL